MFSDADCDAYSWFTKHHGKSFAKCFDNSVEYTADQDDLKSFTYCITNHFMTKMGAKNSCYDGSVRPDSDTNDKNTITLLSKDRLLYTFMVDTLDAENTCQARNDAVTFSPDNCG